jgi:hypothetical protein
MKYFTYHTVIPLLGGKAGSWRCHDDILSVGGIGGLRHMGDGNDTGYSVGTVHYHMFSRYTSQGTIQETRTH